MFSAPQHPQPIIVTLWATFFKLRAFYMCREGDEAFGRNLPSDLSFLGVCRILQATVYG